MKDLKFRYGSWAIVTGASSGIGEKFAEYLASVKINLVLIARREKLLKDLQAKFKSKYQIEVIVLVLNLTEEGCVDQILKTCNDLDIGILINNAGSGNPGFFGECNIQAEKELIALNCSTPMELTRGILPQMLVRGRGAIIFVSSLIGFQGVPYLANYSAMKGYLLNLGEALYHENKKRGVDVLVVAPGGTKTPGRFLHEIDYSKLPINWMNSETVVSATFSALGRRQFIIPGIRNHMTACLSGGLWTRGFVQRYMLKLAKKIFTTKS